MDKIKYALLVTYCVLFAVARFLFNLVVVTVRFLVRMVTGKGKLLRLPNQTIKQERGLTAPKQKQESTVTPEEAFQYGVSAGMSRARSEAARLAALARWKKRKD